MMLRNKSEQENIAINSLDRFKLGPLRNFESELEVESVGLIDTINVWRHSRAVIYVD